MDSSLPHSSHQVSSQNALCTVCLPISIELALFSLPTSSHRRPVCVVYANCKKCKLKVFELFASFVLHFLLCLIFTFISSFLEVSSHFHFHSFIFLKLKKKKKNRDTCSKEYHKNFMRKLEGKKWKQARSLTMRIFLVSIPRR